MPIDATEILEKVEAAILSRMAPLTDDEEGPPILREIKVVPYNAAPESVAEALGRFAPLAPVGILSWPTINFGQASRVATAQTIELQLAYTFATINETRRDTDSRRNTLFDEFGIIAPALTDLLINGAGELPAGWQSIHLTLTNMTPHDLASHSIAIYSIAAIVKSKAIYSA